MSPENFVKAWVAAFCHAEAAHCGGHDAMLAVACVLRNRVKKGWFGGDWLKVVDNAAEASALTPKTYTPIDLSDPGFRRLLQEVDDIFLGMYPDSYTEGGLYYMDALYPTHGQQLKPWFQEKILQDGVNHPRKAQVGMLMIFS